MNIRNMRLMNYEFKPEAFLPVPLADRLLVLVVAEGRTLPWAERRISTSACQTPIVRGNAVNVDTLLDNSSSDCKISLMEHFRLHHRYKELQ